MRNYLLKKHLDKQATKKLACILSGFQITPAEIFIISEDSFVMNIKPADMVHKLRKTHTYI